MEQFRVVNMNRIRQSDRDQWEVFDLVRDGEDGYSPPVFEEMEAADTEYGAWYYEDAEGEPIGPYVTERQARKAANKAQDTETGTESSRTDELSKYESAALGECLHHDDGGASMIQVQATLTALAESADPTEFAPAALEVLSGLQKHGLVVSAGTDREAAKVLGMDPERAPGLWHLTEAGRAAVR